MVEAGERATCSGFERVRYALLAERCTLPAQSGTYLNQGGTMHRSVRAILTGALGFAVVACEEDQAPAMRPDQ
jgi:hypothetical protein